jgi:predicted kinase
MPDPSILTKIISEISVFKQPKLLLLVGLPLSGKDSLIRQLNLNDFEVLSRDELLTKDLPEKDYRDAYTAHDSKEIDKIFFREMDKIRLGQKNVIINATHLKIKRRRKVMLRFPDYAKICLLLPLISFEEFCIRNLIREKESAKKVPEKLYHEMLNLFEVPTQEEGWDLIIDLDNL